MHPMWKVYKSKVMKTLNPDLEDGTAEEVQVQDVESEVSPVQEDEGPSAVTQLAKKVHVVGTRGWNRMSALFSKEDEHQLLEESDIPAADHPLAVQPEDPRPPRRSGFWDSFATKWQQKQAAAAAAASMEGGEEGGTVRGEEEVGEGGGEGGQEGQNVEQEESDGGGSLRNSFSKYASLGGGGGGGNDTSFKWNFVTSKLAELKTKST